MLFGSCVAEKGEGQWLGWAVSTSDRSKELREIKKNAWQKQNNAHESGLQCQGFFYPTVVIHFFFCFFWRFTLLCLYCSDVLFSDTIQKKQTNKRLNVYLSTYLIFKSQLASLTHFGALPVPQPTQRLWPRNGLICFLGGGSRRASWLCLKRLPQSDRKYPSVHSGSVSGGLSSLH